MLISADNNSISKDSFVEEMFLIIMTERDQE
jgi:hypothetical protein